MNSPALDSLVDRMANLISENRQGLNEYQTLAEVKIPDLMFLTLGLEDYVTSSGVHIQIQDAAPKVSVQGNRREELHLWLQDHGHFDSLKKIQGPFRTKAGALDRIARSNAEESALRELAARQLSEGNSIDLELMGISRVVIAEIVKIVPPMS